MSAQRAITASSILLSFALAFALALALVLATSERALASGGRANTPEYFYQPGAGIFDLSIESHQLLSGSSATSVGSTKTGDVKFGNAGFLAELGLGLTDSWAFSVKMGTDSSTIEHTSTAGVVTPYKRSGRSDVTLLLSNISALGAWNLNIGVGAGLSPGKHLDESTTAEGNQLSGGTSIINYLGLSGIIGSGIYVGGKAQYVTRTQGTGNTNDSAPADYSIDGGNTTTLAGFAQWELLPFAADVTASYHVIDSVIKTYASGSKVTSEGYNILAADFGAQYAFTPAVNLRLAYQMAMLSDQVTAGTTLGAHRTSQIGVRVRFEF